MSEHVRDHRKDLDAMCEGTGFGKRGKNIDVPVRTKVTQKKIETVMLQQEDGDNPDHQFTAAA